LPPPSIDLLLDEAARFRGYSQSAWDREPWRKKARVLAHFLEHNLRESYAIEKARLEAKRKERGGGSENTTDWSRFRQGGNR
jgi:hypothetical protein